MTSPALPSGSGSPGAGLRVWSPLISAGGRLMHRLVVLSNRMHLPSPSVLPVAGAVVGIYSGLLAGVFANLIALVGAIRPGPGGSLRRSPLR